MLRKNFLTFLSAVALSFIGVVAVSAQVGMVRGRVEMKKADGTVVPVVGATIDAYRLDIKGKLSPAETNKKGEFVFAGFTLGGQYAIAVSAPNVRAQVFPGIKAGDEKVFVTVAEGDGKRFTEEEARQALNAAPPAAGKTGELTAEQKKQQAEREKEIAEITAKNAKTQSNDALIKKVLEEGNKAFSDKNYDVAIAKYDEGINAEPDYAGSAPVLLNNKTVALLVRARNNYNASVKGDPAAKAAGLASVKKDLDDAVAASDRSLTVLKTATSTDAAVQKSYEANKFQALGNRKEAYQLMAKTGADRTKGKEVVTAFEEYMAVETDAKKKADAQLTFAEALQDSNEFDLAIAEFEKILANDPNNVDALAGAGLSLVTVGYVSAEKDPAKGKAQFQQAANYLQKFLDTAPDTHKYKADAKGIVETLKKEQSVAPQKIPKGATTKKKT